MMSFLSNHLCLVDIMFAVVISIFDACSYKYELYNALNFVYYFKGYFVGHGVESFSIYFTYLHHYCVFFIVVKDCGCYHFSLCSASGNIVLANFFIPGVRFQYIRFVHHC